MNKYFIAASILILSYSSLPAQTEKGNYLLGASNLLEFRNLYTLTTSSISNDTKKENVELLFSPIFGYFFIDNLSVGVMPGYFYQKENSDQSSYMSTRTLSISAFLRYYIGRQKFRPFVHGGIGYLNRHQKNQFDFINNSEPYKWNGGSVVYDIGAGLSYFISRNVSLDLFAAYTYYKVDMNYKGDPSLNELLDHSFEAKDLKINLSLIFYFGSKNQNQTKD